MGKLKRFIRRKIIDVIKFAIREELGAQMQSLSPPPMTMHLSLKSDEIDKQIERWTWERFKRTDKQIERWTWERFQRTKKEFGLLEQSVDSLKQDMLECLFLQNKIPYYLGEKIRVVMLFQIPSCWASVDSVWKALKEDSRFDVTMLLYDRELKEPAQMKGCREFLLEKEIDFAEAESYNFSKERPHILIYQTPWDNVHRPDFLKADAIKRQGIRVVYLPYGIPYSASVSPDFIFSIVKLRAKPWLSFELSNSMIVEHKFLSPYGADYLLATGLPKFDSLYNREQFPLESYILEMVGSRRIVFWQMHFPSLNGNANYPEPHISEYLKFAKKIREYGDLFFIVRPHPKYFDMCIEKGFADEAEEFIEVLKSTENLYIYNEPDYRPALLNSDYVIGDRSALMIEAIVLGVPVLYMTNFYYKEKMLSAVEPIFESYYQGSESYDMERFVDLIIYRGKDYKADERRKACELCVPLFDGNCGQRIVNSMAEKIIAEVNGNGGFSC